MYISRVEMDTRRRNTMVALVNPQIIHGAVESSFSSERKRRLWRLDQLDGRLYLLILSEEKPDLGKLVTQFGNNDSSEPQTKVYDDLLERIQPGSLWRFRLTANPTHSRVENSGRDENGRFQRGKVQACSTLRFQEEWLLERSKKHGFILPENNFTVTASHWLRFHKGNSRRIEVSILAVSYEGVLKVTDAERFRDVLTNGIGRGKAYGLGLVTVIGLGGEHG